MYQYKHFKNEYNFSVIKTLFFYITAKSRFASYNENRSRIKIWLVFWNFVFAARFLNRDAFQYCKGLVYSQNAEGRETRSHTKNILSKVTWTRLDSEGNRCRALIPFSWVYRAHEVNWQRPPLNTRNTFSIGNSDHSFHPNLLLQRLVCLNSVAKWMRVYISRNVWQSICLTCNISFCREFRTILICLW